MLTKREYFALVSTGDSLVACGGLDETSILLRTCERFDPASEAWTGIASLSFGRSLLSLAWAWGRVYAASGHTGPAPHTPTQVVEVREADVVWTNPTRHAFGSFLASAAFTSPSETLARSGLAGPSLRQRIGSVTFKS